MSTLPTTAPSIEQRARRRVALKKGFLIHALVFVLVNAGLYLIWSAGGWGDGWGQRHASARFFPMWGWALGLTIHGIVVFIRLQGEGVTERMVDREIEALKRREGRNRG